LSIVAHDHPKELHSELIAGGVKCDFANQTSFAPRHSALQHISRSLAVSPRYLPRKMIGGRKRSATDAFAYNFQTFAPISSLTHKATACQRDRRTKIAKMENLSAHNAERSLLKASSRRQAVPLRR